MAWSLAEPLLPSWQVPFRPGGSLVEGFLQKSEAVADHPTVQPPRSAPHSASQLVHVGRQPLYDRAGVVAGYELLFRGSADALEASRANAFATSQVIVNAFTEFGIDEVVGDRMCFINLTRDFLVGQLALPFGPEQAVLEVLENINVDDEVVAGVASLVDRGYAIALDDFVGDLGHDKLLGMATYVKLGLLGVEDAAVAEAVSICRQYRHLKLVAERVETAAKVQFARDLGFDLFQGYALGRPNVMSTTTLSPSRLRRIELLGALTSDDVDIEQVVSIVTGDPALSFRVLRATNSAASGLTRRVSSVHEAVMLLGTVRIRQWVSLMLVSDIAHATEEQLSTTMARARLCQNVAERLNLSGDAAFTLGLLAGVAELISASPAELASKLPLTEEVSEALVNRTGKLGDVLATVEAYEHYDREVLSGAPVGAADLAHAYLAAVGWSMRTVSGVVGSPERPREQVIRRA
jgi:c-di-GMP-related signal transduction protein